MASVPIRTDPHIPLIRRALHEMIVFRWHVLDVAAKERIQAARRRKLDDRTARTLFAWLALHDATGGWANHLNGVRERVSGRKPNMSSQPRRNRRQYTRPIA